IIQMVQSAQDEKSPTQLFIERFEGTYVKIVLAVVIIMMFLPYLFFGWTLTESIYRAMVLLVVASPCALVASIMPATLSAISNSAKNGVLFKGGVHVENLSHVNVVAFDKTGTLTNGVPEVTDVYVNNNYDETDLLTIVGAIENEAIHPLAQAITKYSNEKTNRSLKSVDVSDMTTVSGNGVSATVDGEKWKIGNDTFVGEEEAAQFYDGMSKRLAEEGKTIDFVKHEAQVVDHLALKDTIRKDTKQQIHKLREKGITAESVAEEVEIDEYIAECLPDEKVTHVKNLRKQYENVAMVGDGINDAPALASANVGVAMGQGTDVALETADVVLMKNDLSKIKNTIDLSGRMNRIVKQNVFFSLAVIFVLIVSNFLQVIDLPLGVIGHEGSTILVILNGLRLLK